jgi:hypothetical protein
VGLLQRRMAIVLLALWVPEPSWLLGVIAVAEGSHPISVRWAQGDLDLVLHHHDAASAVDEYALQADDHPHGDHVIRGMRDGVLAGRPGRVGVAPTTTAGALQACVAPRAVSAPRLVGGFGLSPPRHSVVLRI